MICNVCGNSSWEFVKRYNTPDKYEVYVGVDTPMCRRWMKCCSCGLYQAFRSYPLEMLTPIYTNGYRASDFRGESLEETFAKITTLPPDESENIYRVNWLAQRVPCCSLLDVGSGFGVFPYEMKLRGYKPIALEPNHDAAVFIWRHLGIFCIRDFFTPMLARSIGEKDLVSLIHVLEHIEDPESFLSDVKEVLKPGGKLFVEVPDAVEFDCLDGNHDEFNSCHVFFFTVPTLCKLVECSGFKVTDIHRTRTKARGLSRIMMIAEKQ